MTPKVPVAQITRPAWASGIQPVGNRARRIRAASAKWRRTGSIPCMTWVVAPPDGGVNASESPTPDVNKPRLDRNAALQNEVLAGGVSGAAAGQPQHNAGDFFRRADPAHGLRSGESLARGFIIAGVAQPLLQRRR